MQYKIERLPNGFCDIIVPVGELSLEKTFKCGQCFRWVRLGDGTFKGVLGDKLVMIKRFSDKSTDTSDVFTVNLDYNDAVKFANYLGLNDDYSPLRDINLTNFEKKAMEYGKGIRILHQDIWETSVSFIISQRNNIPKIENTIYRLCEKFGTKKTYMIRGNDVEYYTFPTPEQIINAGITGLNSCGLGYRSEYVYKFALDFSMNKNNFLKCLSDNYDSKSTISFLITHLGIGPKVANCISLFGYNKLDAFPIDVWIQRIADKHYNGTIDYQRYGKLAGLMQQYLFYYTKYNEQES